MKEVLLVLSAAGAGDRAIDYAVERAKKAGVGLVALYLLEAEPAKEASDAFTDMGFVGEKPSAQISETLIREYRQRGYEELGRVQIKAMEAGVGFEPLLEEGDFASKTLEAARRRDASLVVLVKGKERHFLRYFSKSYTDEVRARAGCEVVVIEQ